MDGSLVASLEAEMNNGLAEHADVSNDSASLTQSHACEAFSSVQTVTYLVRFTCVRLR